MRLIFDHTYGFGKLSKENFLFIPFVAELEQKEYKEHLENGWYPLTKNIWFQTRSTRIDLSKYEPTKTVKKNFARIKPFYGVAVTNEKKEIFTNIYNKYIKYNGYDSTGYSIDEIINNSNGYVYYALDNKIIAFSFHKIIEDAFLGIEFAWDYEKPSLSMGHVNIYYASLLAKKHRCKYIYLSSGYESACIYKSNYPGFQWWKGYEWSEDKKLYKKLCKRDDKINITGLELLHQP